MYNFFRVHLHELKNPKYNVHIMTEEQLLDKVKSGDSIAFNQLVTVHQKMVLNICYRFLLNKEDAEDITQEVFIEVFHSIKQFKGDSKLSTWIYRIATSKSLDELKKQKRKKRISEFGKALGLESFTNKVIGFDRPDKTIENKEGYQHLLAALDKLPENQRIALTLSKIEGYRNPEIAELMQISLTAVDSLIYRAKQNLKEILSS